MKTEFHIKNHSQDFVGKLLNKYKKEVNEIRATAVDNNDHETIRQLHNLYDRIDRLSDINEKI